MLGSVAILAGLAVADRFTAWLIGEFPTSGLLWHIRFEFLRPVGVYYDVVEQQFGSIAPATFSAITLLAAALVCAGVMSRIRLARAISCHALLIAALILTAMSWTTYGYAFFGMQSRSYELLGLMLSLIAGALCLRIHMEYAGWNPALSRIVQRLWITIVGVRTRVEAGAIDLIEQLGAAPVQRTVPARLRPDQRGERRTR